MFVSPYESDQKSESSKMKCANCGGSGHIYKNCNHPITSYGIVCFQLRYDSQNNLIPKYLMVQRKDSLSYVEFMRGKYNIDQKSYLMRLISNMTKIERDNLMNMTFDELWKALWLTEDSKGFIREYNDAKNKFEMLRKGCIMKNNNNDMFYFDIKYIVENTICNLTEPEWGFPKGRKNMNEHDMSTALRECREESGVDPSNIYIINNMKPFEEIFSGTNKIRYRHVYYLGYCAKAKKKLFNPYNKQQAKEIKDVNWFSFEKALSNIRDHNIERKELLKRINSLILKNIPNNVINSNNDYKGFNKTYTRAGFL